MGYFPKQSILAKATEKCGPKQAMQWVTCCDLPLKNGLSLDTSCPKDFEDTGPASAKACYYDCAYKELGLMTNDSMMIPEKVQAFMRNYFKGYPDFQEATKTANEVTFEISENFCLNMKAFLT